MSWKFGRVKDDRRFFLGGRVGLGLFLLVGSVHCALAKTSASHDVSHIEWDASSLRLIAQDGGYGRMIRLRDGNILCSYSLKGKIKTRLSTNDGSSWNSAVPVAEIAYGGAANPELIELQNGKVLCCFNERPKDGVHPFAISTCWSADAGRTWGPVKRIFEADIRFENGCWEPAALQLPSGELQIYFANESPYRASAEQEISLLRSFDMGQTWKDPITASFRAGHRDGMPVPLLLQQPPGGPAVAIEDNGLGKTFRPVIVYSSALDNWKSGPVLAGSARRWPAVRNFDPSIVLAGAPYLRQMPDGETVLSFQCTEPGRTKNHMVVYVGNAWARNFTNRSVPFQVPPDIACLWNSLFVKSSNVVTAISGTTMEGIQGLWAIDGRLVPASNTSTQEANTEIVAVWQHRANGGPPSYHTFYSNGAIDHPVGLARWSIQHQELTMRWPYANGEWVDRCVMSSDGLSYLGTNQQGARLTGQISQSR